MRRPRAISATHRSIVFATAGTAISLGFGGGSQLLTFLALRVSASADGYAAALTVPAFVLSAATGPIVSIFPQRFWSRAARFSRADAVLDSRRSARRLALGTAVVACVGYIASPLIVEFVFRGLSPIARNAAIDTQRILLLALPIAVWGAVTGALLQTNSRFGSIAVNGALPSIGVVLGAFLGLTFHLRMAQTVVLLAWGRGAGYLVAALWLAAMARRLGDAPSAALNDGIVDAAPFVTPPSSKTYAFLVVGNMCSLALPLVERSLASGAGVGTVATIFYASQLAAIAGSLASTGIATVSGVEFARAIANHGIGAINEVRTAMFRRIFATGGLVLLALGAVALAGVTAMRISPGSGPSISRVMGAFYWYGPAAIPSAAGSVLVAFLYALRKVEMLTVLSIASLAVYGIVGIFVIHPTSAPGLAALAQLYWWPPFLIALGWVVVMRVRTTDLSTPAEY